ncbi:unnamed protein product [Penicillium pancosmium]
MNQELPPPEDYDNPAPKPGEGCALAGCDKTEELNRCSACKVFLYCTREHQVEDRPAHKTTCNEIKKARANVERQKQALIDDPEFRNDNPFENHVGHFWKLRETRPYMMSLSKLAQAFQNKLYRPALEAELEVCMELLRLCPGDNMGVRETVPALLIRLNRDQECYDFIKWWATTAKERDYDWGTSDRYLNIKNADIFEPCGFINEKSLIGSLSLHACMMILKIKFVLDLIKLRATQNSIEKMSANLCAEAGPPPEEIFEELKRGSCRSSAILARPELLVDRNLTPKINVLRKQMDSLSETIDRHNKHYFPALFGPDMELGGDTMFAMGSPEEMRMALQNTWHAWVESTGTLSFMLLQRERELDTHFNPDINIHEDY